MVIRFVEIERDENTVTVEQRKGICRTCNGSGEQLMTNADRIRAMSDEELAQRIHMFVGLEDRIPYCQNLPECDALLDTEEGIPEEKCVGCLLKWLQQPE